VGEAIYKRYGGLAPGREGTPIGGTPYNPVGFGGQFGYYTDTETGLLCLTHRYYDPGTGKFINRDPIGYQGGENLYGFADGNPVNESDPNGTNAFTDAWNKWWHHAIFGGGGVKGPRLGDVNPSYKGLEDLDGIDEVPGYNLPQNSKKVLQRVNDAYSTVAVGALTAPLGMAGAGEEAIAGGYRGFSSKAVWQSAQAILKGGSKDVTVASRGEAKEVFDKLFVGQGYRNTTGYLGNHLRDVEKFPQGKFGTFHWDFHDTMHGGVAHIQVHTFDGRTIRIFFSHP